MPRSYGFCGSGNLVSLNERKTPTPAKASDQIRPMSSVTSCNRKEGHFYRTPTKPSKWAPTGFGRPCSWVLKWTVLAFFLGSSTTLNFHAASTRKGYLKGKTMGVLRIASSASLGPQDQNRQQQQRAEQQKKKKKRENRRDFHQ
jgi:hypothetical protein